MFKQRLFRTAGLVAAVLIGVAVVVTGQSARSTPLAGSSLDELLAEVRGSAPKSVRQPGQIFGRNYLSHACSFRNSG